MFAPFPVPIFNKLLNPPTAYRLRRRKESHVIPRKSKIAAPSWFEYTKVVLRVLRVAFVSDSAPCHTRVARVARSARSGDVPLVLPLWTWLEGEEEDSEEEEEEEASTDDGDEEEEEETEEEDEDEPAHGKKQA